MKKIIALLLVAVICLSLVACGDNKPTDNPTETTTTVAEKVGPVEITLENFETYFEFVEESFFTKDGSGNYAHLRYRHYYKLKDNYNIDETKSSIKISYGYTQTKKSVEIDFDNQKFTLGEQIGEKKTHDNISITKLSKMTYKDYAILLLQPTHAVKGATEIMYFSDFKLNSVEGTLYLVKAQDELAHTHTNEAK